MRRILLGVVTGLILLASSLDAAGTAAGEEFMIPIGARPVSLGQSFTAVAGGALSPYWNVAGLGDTSYQEFSFTHLNWFEGVALDSLSWALPFGKYSGFGFFATRLNSSDVEVTGETLPTDPDYPLPGQYAASTESGNIGALVAGVSFGKKMFESFKAGVGIKYLSEDFAGSGFKGFVADVGGLLKPFAGATGVGLTVQNIGGKMDGFSPPLTVRVGLVKKVNPAEIMEMGGVASEGTNAERNIMVTGDVSYETVGRAIGMHGGFEYALGLGKYQQLALRAGISRQVYLPLLLTVGAGYNLGLGDTEFRLDYAYVPYQRLGDAHRFSLAVLF